MRLIEVVSSRTGWHYILLGWDSTEVSNFKLQMWITKYEKQMVSWVQSMGLNFCTFLEGDIWLHNDDTVDRCNLFDEKRDCIVGVISNEEPLKIKLYDALGVWSNKEWEVTSVTIPATMNHPDGMQSKIPTALFKKRSGVWKARFLRNMKSTTSAGTGTAGVLDAIQGEPLKGQVAYLTLKNTSNDQVSLFKIECEMTEARV